MFGLGFPELILILVIALIIFGPGKLPEVGKAIGKSVREFKKATNEIKKEFDLDESSTTFNPQPREVPKETPNEGVKEATNSENSQKPTAKNPYTTVYDEPKEGLKEETQEKDSKNS